MLHIIDGKLKTFCNFFNAKKLLSTKKKESCFLKTMKKIMKTSPFLT